jgi:hypothetical protein
LLLERSELKSCDQKRRKADLTIFQQNNSFNTINNAAKHTRFIISQLQSQHSPSVMNQFGSHHRARTAPSSSSSSSDETPAPPLRLASHLPIQPQIHSRQYLAVPTWQPNSEARVHHYNQNTLPAKRLRTRSTPIKRIDLGFIPLPRHSKGPLASDKPFDFEKIRKEEVGHFEYMDLDSDGGWDKEK